MIGAIFYFIGLILWITYCSKDLISQKDFFCKTGSDAFSNNCMVAVAFLIGVLFWPLPKLISNHLNPISILMEYVIRFVCICK